MNRPGHLNEFGRIQLSRHVQSKPSHRSNENAARRAHRERADINGRKIDEGAIAQAKIISKD